MHSCPECGAVFGKARSLPDHKRLFALLRAAYVNWPESFPFQPISEEHLRAWLLVEVNHRDVEFIAYPQGCEDNPALKTLFKLAVEATHAATVRRRGHSFLHVGEAGVEIRTPKSIDFRSVGQREFGAIREAAEAVLETALGVKADQLLRERAA